MTVLDLTPSENDIPPENAVCGTDVFSARRPVIAVGNFDGVHMGHMALLKETVALSRNDENTVPAVFTFRTHPFPEKNPFLTTLEEKLRLFAKAGIRYCILEDFGKIRTMTPLDFIEKYLIANCRVAGAVCGYNYHFGKDGIGDAGLFGKQLSEHGIPAKIVAPVLTDGLPVSSSRIRMLLASGDITAVNRCLGYPYSFSLPVIHGKELGRTIGVPTVNQPLSSHMALPKDGVYATAVTVGNCVYPAVTNIGIRPSIDDGHDTHIRNAETHMIGFSGWLYGKTIRVFFRRYLRAEQKFSSLTALQEQIQKDINASVSDFNPHFRRIP